MRSYTLDLYTDISGNNIGVKCYEYGTGENGIYIQGGVHGGEVTYFIFEKLHKYLSKNEKRLKSKITLVPIINPPAWNQRVYYYTAGKFDFYKGKDWNRSYPGSETTLSARNSGKIMELASRHNLAIDLHTARVSKPYAIYNHAKLLPYIKQLGLPYNYFVKDAKYSGSFDDELMAAGINSFTLECGSHDSYDADSIEEVSEGLIRIINQAEITSSFGKLFSSIETIYSPISGFIHYHVSPRQQVKKNMVLCTISNSAKLGETVEIRAAEDCIVFELAKTHIVWTGDELVRIVPIKNLSEIQHE